MIVVCDGMPRSGSTWAFNVCAGLLAIHSPGARIFSAYRKQMAEHLAGMDSAYQHYVLKTHALDVEGMALTCVAGVRTVHTHRDPYDAVGSFLAMFEPAFEIALEALRRALLVREFHRRYQNALIIPYHRIRRAPRQTIREIAAYLDVNVSAADIQQLSGELSLRKVQVWTDRLGEDPVRKLIRLGNAAYDPETNFHWHHIRDGRSGYGRAMLSERQRSAVRELVAEMRRREL